MTKKEQAREMYMLGMKQVEIARILEVTNESVTNWKKAGNWEESKIQRDLLEIQNEETVREITAYQLSVMKNQMNAWIESGERKPFDNSTIQGVRYLFNCYKSQGLKWEHYVKVMRQFVEFVDGQNKDFAKELLMYSDMFLVEKGKHLDE